MIQLKLMECLDLVIVDTIGKILAIIKMEFTKGN